MVTCSDSVVRPSPAAADPLSSCDLISRRFHEALAEDDLFVFHRSQWNCLAYTFTQVLRLLRPVLQSASPASPSSLAITVRVLHEAMSEAERCMLDRSASLGQPVKHSWLLDKALMEVTATDVIHVHLARFLWAFSITAMVAEPVWRQADAVPSDVILLTEALSIIWQDVDAKGDLSSCHEFLTTMNCEEHAKSCLLAQFIDRKLLHHMQELDSAPSQDLPAYLWIDSSSHEPNSKAVGDGSNGKIYQTEWLGGRFAIKEFFRTQSSLFVQEAAIQARARHPNVLTLVCCTKTTPPLSHSLVMELMQKDLRMLMLQRKDSGISPPFSLCVALDLMLQIAQGMEYLHSIHIMHRDLKSLNVLVEETFDKSDDKDMDPSFIHLKVCDFGMSKAKLASEMYSSLQVGTTWWRAPEVFEKYHEGDTSTAMQGYTKKADVYSFAMVCYEILTGEIPYYGLNVTKSVLAGVRPTLPSNCPRALSCLIKSCWKKEPSERPSFNEICSILRFLKFCVLLQHDKGASLLHYLSQPLPPGLCVSIQGAESSRQFGGPNPLKIPLEMHCCGMLLRQSFDANESVQWKPAGQVKAVPRSKARPKADKSHQSKHQHGVPGGESQLFPLGWMQKLWKKPNRNPAAQILVLNEVIPKLLKEFTFEEMEDVTDGFSCRIAVGGFGPVYKGKLRNGNLVAVKVASNASHLGSNEFLNEVALLSGIQHKNLVGFLGYCNKRKLMLVYEFMSSGSLFDCLHGEYAKASPLSWATRLRIMIDCARGFEYLHHGYKLQIIHRDIKSSNILLNDKLEAKVSDFGISRSTLMNEIGAPLHTTVMGSEGYVDPEYLDTMKLTEKVDVYGFGVLIFEIVCGRPVTFLSSNKKIHIVEWAKSSIERGAINDIVDQSLQEKYDTSAMWRVLEIALSCVQFPGFQRPNMSVVFHELKEAERLEFESDLKSVYQH